MSGQTLVRPRPRPTPSGLGRGLAIVLLLAVSVSSGVALAARLAKHLEGPPLVAKIEIKNPSDLLIDVDVTGRSQDGWLPVSIARPQLMTTTRYVMDQGEIWRFRFRSAGHYGGELHVSRHQLAGAGWQMVIPQHVIERLRDAGATRSARTY